MYNGQVSVPLVIRAPMGGRRGYGPTHSQSLERMFLSTPGLRVVAPSHRHDATELIRAAIDDANPVLFIEGKLLYATEMRPDSPGFTVRATEPPYPAVLLSNNGDGDPDATVVTYGGALAFVERAMAAAFERDEITCEIIALSQIAPLELDLVAESVNRSGRLLVVEEGPRSWGWGAEVVARAAERLGHRLKARPARVAALDVPLATSRPLEDHALPAERDIARAIEVLMLQ